MIKYFIGKTYKPLLENYLSKTRRYNYKEIKLLIHPDVFHPAFFFSTKNLLKYISHLNVKQKTFLELGAGSGLISIWAAKSGANVTATDINPVAVEYLKKNSEKNKVCLNIVHSDLFKNIPHQCFDIIAINPPFYKRNPKTNKDYAWYCGENGEYFHSMFDSLTNYMHSHTIMLMILSSDCDLEMIRAIAFKNEFNLNCVFRKKNFIEENFIFKIEMPDQNR